MCLYAKGAIVVMKEFKCIDIEWETGCVEVSALLHRHAMKFIQLEGTNTCDYSKSALVAFLC